MSIVPTVAQLNKNQEKKTTTIFTWIEFKKKKILIGLLFENWIDYLAKI